MTAPGVIHIEEVAAPAPGPGRRCCGSRPWRVVARTSTFSWAASVQPPTRCAGPRAVRHGRGARPRRHNRDNRPQGHRRCRSWCAASARRAAAATTHLRSPARAGFQRPAPQELWVTRADNLVPLPDPRSASSRARWSTGVGGGPRRGARRRHAGRRVAVLGAGRSATWSARPPAPWARGCSSPISASSPRHSPPLRPRRRLEPAPRDLEPGIRRVFGGEGFDLAFECVGVEATITSCHRGDPERAALTGRGRRVSPRSRAFDIGLVRPASWCWPHSDVPAPATYEQRSRSSSRAPSPPTLMSRHFPMADFQEAYRFPGESARRGDEDLHRSREPRRPAAVTAVGLARRPCTAMPCDLSTSARATCCRRLGRWRGVSGRSFQDRRQLLRVLDARVRILVLDTRSPSTRRY